MEESPHCSSDGDTPRAAATDRRGFAAQVATLTLGGLALLVPAAAAVVAFLNPLRHRSSQAGGLLRLTRLEVLPEDGTPRRFPVVADRTDAWSHFADEPVGALFLRRTGDPASPVAALQVVCPHMGCHVEYRDTPEGGQFSCPCHGAHFDLAGKRLEANSQSPRDLDTIEVDPQRLKAGEVWVKFQEFQSGTAEKVAKA